MAKGLRDRVQVAIVSPQNVANMEAQRQEAAGRADLGFQLRVFGRLNGIENALLEIAEALEKGQR